jgi:hypothetical protein
MQVLRDVVLHAKHIDARFEFVLHRRNYEVIDHCGADEEFFVHDFHEDRTAALNETGEQIDDEGGPGLHGGGLQLATLKSVTRPDCRHVVGQRASSSIPMQANAKTGCCAKSNAAPAFTRSPEPPLSSR